MHLHATLLKDHLKIAHFRDPWSGLPILAAKSANCRTVYEVNALPSLELPVRYKGLTDATLDRIKDCERQCLEQADAIVCPSQVIKNCLIKLGTRAEKITVIPNGATIIDPSTLPVPHEAPESYLIYFGAVQPWQGIEVLFKAMTFLGDLTDLQLVLCVSGSKPRLKFLHRLAERLQLGDRLIWHHRMAQNDLQPWLAHAAMSVAPLTECTRNLVQGCCPLKIVESMAMGVPVIASNLPVVRELVEHEKTGWLVRPDRPSELARAVRLLAFHEQVRQEIGSRARTAAVDRYSWADAARTLQNLYKTLQQ